MTAGRARAHYPRTPGWIDDSVSRDNAIFNEKRFNHMQWQVLTLYRSGFTGTADEAAHALRLSPFSTRPRCTELVKQGLLEKFERDRSTPGRHAWKLRLADPQSGFDFDDGQPTERDEWLDYDRDC